MDEWKKYGIRTSSPTRPALGAHRALVSVPSRRVRYSTAEYPRVGGWDFRTGGSASPTISVTGVTVSMLTLCHARVSHRNSRYKPHEPVCTMQCNAHARYDVHRNIHP